MNPDRSTLGLRRELLRRFPWLRETDYLRDLRQLWGSGLATHCGVLAPLSSIISERLKQGDTRDLAELFAYLDPMLDRSMDAVLAEAVETCFFENIAVPEPSTNVLYTPLLGPNARGYLERAWPGTTSRDISLGSSD